MFPESHNFPTRMIQSDVRGSITLDISFELRSPVPLVCCWLPAMLRAYMPEASIDENCYFAGSKDNVRTNLYSS